MSPHYRDQKVIRTTYVISFSKCIADAFSPAEQLEEFVEAAGQSLSTVTTLVLGYENTTDSTFTWRIDKRNNNLMATTSAEMDEALAMLMNSCPGLTSLNFSGQLSIQTLTLVGGACPKLHSLTINADDKQPKYFILVLMLLSDLLPRVTSLSLPNFCYLPLAYLSKNVGIVYLDIGGHTLTCDADWKALPPHLQFLKCDEIQVGPPVLPRGRKFLNSLLHLEATEPGIPLHIIIQILHAAPNLQSIKDGHYPVTSSSGVHIGIELEWSTAADLSYLHQRLEAGLTLDALYSFGTVCEREAGRSVQPLTDALPYMTHAAMGSFSYFLQPELGSLLKALPSLTSLDLCNPLCIDDIGIQHVAVCPQLTTLKLMRCKDVSPMGLLALCQQLPKLHSVHCTFCCLMVEPFVGRCVQLLERQGLHVKIVTEHPHHA